jgi:hypothetical protein
MGERLPRQYFQDGGDEPYAGPENRDYNRPRLTEEGQLLVNAICGRMKGSCKDNCVIDKEAQPYVSKAIEAVKEVGEGSIPVGINKTRELILDVDQEQKTKRAIKDKAISTVTAIIVTAVIGLIAYAIVHKVQGG